MSAIGRALIDYLDGYAIARKSRQLSQTISLSRWGILDQPANAHFFDRVKIYGCDQLVPNQRARVHRTKPFHTHS